MDSVSGVIAQARERAKGIGLPKIGKSDAMAGVTTGIANVPDGMASAVLAGVNPVYGIYTLIIGTPLASLSISTQLMMFNTTSAMTLVAVDGLGTRSGEDRVAALMAIALVAGAFQFVLGLLGLGMLTKFVSNSVMIGFLTGIAALIIMGQLWDLTGYVGEGGTKLEKTAQLLANLRDVDPWSTAIGVGSLVAMFLLQRTKLGSYNLLVALAGATIFAWIGDFSSVVLVSSLGDIPSSLPSIDLPQLDLIPKMLAAGIAVGTIGLLQAAGVAQAYPNPDGSNSSDSRDFMGQGIANMAASCFRGMAGGGSLSGTALNVSAGARTRWAAVVQAVVVLILILVFSGLLSLIPMAALAALLIYSASLSLKLSAIATISQTSWTSAAGMGVTFFATLVMPLQQAVLVGIAFAAILFLYRASADVRIKQMRIIDNRLVVSDPPAELPSDTVTILDVDGNLFYAGVRTLGKLLPDAKASQRAAVVLRLRGKSEIGTTFFKVIGEYAANLRSNGGVLLLSGVDPVVKQRMTHAGQLDLVGADHIFLADSVVGDSTADALRSGEAWLAAMADGRAAPADGAVPSEALGAVEPVVTSGPSEVVSPPEDRSIATGVDQVTSLVKRLATAESASTRTALIAGILTVALGLLTVLIADVLERLLLPLIGGLFLLAAFFWMAKAVQRSDAARPLNAQLRLLYAGIATVTGASLLIEPFSDYLTSDSSRLLLALGVGLIGATGFLATSRLSPENDRTKADLTVFLVLIGLAVVEVLMLRSERSTVASLGWLAVIGGVVLMAYAFVVDRTTQASDDVSPPEPGAEPAELGVGDEAPDEQARVDVPAPARGNGPCAP